MRVTCLEHRFAVFWALLIFVVTVAGAATSVAAADGQRIGHEIRDECRFTRYPNLCVQTLLGLGSASGSYHQYTDTDMISALVNETLAESNLADNTSNAGFSMLSSHHGTQASQKSQSVSGDLNLLFIYIRKFCYLEFKLSLIPHSHECEFFKFGDLKIY